MDLTLDNRRNKIHSLKLALWIGCGSMLMMFAAWTSAYLVRQAAGNWLEFKLPNIFFVSTAVILLSSVTLQMSFRNFKKGNETLYKSLLIVTLLLGMLFIGLQYEGWNQMQKIGIPLTKNPSGDFIYVLTAFHAAHVVAGLGVLVVALAHAFGLKFKPTPRRQLRFELTTTFWHFVDLLWLYLVVFLVIQS
jgi:cytochrome c oxidase subunit III